MDDSSDEAPVGLQQDRRCSITSFAGLVSWGDVDDFQHILVQFLPISLLLLLETLW